MEGWFQLTSTPATYTYMNPSCVEATRLVENSKHISERSMVGLNIASSSTSFPKKTLAELLELDRQQSLGSVYRCDVKIIDFMPEHAWFKRGCPIIVCNEQAAPTTDKKFFCVTHGSTTECRYLYIPTVTIGDDTASATAMLFDDASKSVVGRPCSDVVASISADDLMKIPEALLSVRDKPFTTYLKLKPYSKTGVTTFLVDQAEPITTASPSVVPQTPLTLSEINRENPTTGVKRSLFGDSASGTKGTSKKPHQE